MRLAKTIAPLLLCLTTSVAAATTATAGPAQPPLRVQGSDHGVDYTVELAPDNRAAVGTIASGRFLPTWDGEAIIVTDDDGILAATVPLTYDIVGHTLELVPSITDDGRRLTLTPADQSPVPLRDINAQQHFFDVVQANLPAVATGAAIGGAIGFLIGFPAGLFILDFITIPITTVVGALIGGAVGLQQSGGDPAVEAALTYAESLVPGASDTIRPAFDALPEPQPR
ncbi:hypothetical protein [Nocardia otitidiscaviarum]|uniref:DUF8020 domain-containing protein n=2 Tax=Nocardia otitidiscaviarum TaxID=1823 RepID=A0A516NEU1_9NOCA|nr:hypothetical protein [Nocardia otitidiscaviarum]MBF6183077.1 hypothetical protein [Nocardia otitidiscaviarum]QDP77426.1 hypothetical protein FOH10_00420 [Nocardia otitidiscaviarum]